MVLASQPLGDVAAALVKLAQVLADAEAAAGAGDHYGPDVVGARGLQRGLELLQRGGVEGVEDVRTFQRDGENGAIPRCFDFGHAREPKGRAVGRHGVASLAECRN